MSIKEWIKSLLEKVFHLPFWEKITDDSDYQRELKSIRYGEKSLLTSGGNNQPMYQIIDLGERFLFADPQRKKAFCVLHQRHGSRGELRLDPVMLG